MAPAGLEIDMLFSFLRQIVARGLVERLSASLIHGVGASILQTVGALVIMLSLAAPASAQQRPARIVALGDSLSAGYLLPEKNAFPTVLERALRERGYKVEVSNAGVSGDTASGGLERLDWAIGDGADLVIVELGANDALRGIDPRITRQALSDIVTRLKARKIAVLLCGMLAPPNYGSEYAARFDSIYADLSKSFGVPLYPFFLEGVAADAKLNQADGLHPTAEGVDVIVKNILPTVQAFLGALPGQRS